MSSTTWKSILEAIIEARPHNRVGHSALIKTGEHEEICNTWASDPFSPYYDPKALSTKVMVEDWDIARSKGSNTRTGRTWRRTTRRHVKRIEQREARKDLQSQLADMHDEREERERAKFMAPRIAEIVDQKLDDLFNENNWLFVTAGPDIQVAMCGSENGYDLPHLDFDLFESEADERESLDTYRHANHLSENHVADADHMITISDDPEHDLILPDVSDLRVGSKLSPSGTVYGKVKYMTLQAPDRDANDLPDMCENMIQAA